MNKDKIKRESVLFVKMLWALSMRLVLPKKFLKKKSVQLKL